MSSNTSNTSFTLFTALPPETRLRVWQIAYETTPRRVVDVEFNNDWGSWCHIAVYGSDRNSFRDTLFQANRESREFMRSRFVRPFSSDLPEPDDWSGNSHPPPWEIEIDLARDKPCISSDHDFDEVLGNLPDNNQETDSPLRQLFRLLFSEKAEMVARKLTNLEVDCNVNRFFGLVPWKDNESYSEKSQEVTNVKSYLSSLEKLHINCDCHCMGGGVACVHTVQANQKLAVATKYCCGLAVEDASGSGPDSDSASDNDSENEDWL